MTLWLHCNTCYRVCQDKCLFFMTSCGHIFCDKCEHRGWKQKCPLCNTLNPAVVPLKNPVPAWVQVFVDDPSATLRKNPSSARQVAATLEWQTSHMKRYLNYLLSKSRHYEAYAIHLKEQLSAREKNERCRMEGFQKTVAARWQQEKDNFQEKFDALKKAAQSQMDQQRNKFQVKLDQQTTYYKEHISTLEKEFVKIRDENTYLKRLIFQKSSPARMSPSGDRVKRNSSPTMKGFQGSSPNNSVYPGRTCHQEKHHSQHSYHGPCHKSSPPSVRPHQVQVSPDTTTSHSRITYSNQTHIQISPGSNIICSKVVSKTPPADASSDADLERDAPSIDERLKKLQRNKSPHNNALSSDQTCQMKTPMSAILSGRVSAIASPSGGKHDDNHGAQAAISKQNVPSIDERLQNLQKNSSPSHSLHSSYQKFQIKTPLPTITSGRVSMRTPPSGGRLGSISPVTMPSLGTPSPNYNYRPKTPKSMPHTMSF